MSAKSRNSIARVSIPLMDKGAEYAVKNNRPELNEGSDTPLLLTGVQPTSTCVRILHCTTRKCCSCRDTLPDRVQPLSTKQAVQYSRQHACSAPTLYFPLPVNWCPAAAPSNCAGGTTYHGTGRGGSAPRKLVAGRRDHTHPEQNKHFSNRLLS